MSKSLSLGSTSAEPSPTRQWLADIVGCGPVKPDDLHRLNRDESGLDPEGLLIMAGGVDLTHTFPESEDPWGDYEKYIKDLPMHVLGLPGPREEEMGLSEWRNIFVSSNRASKVDATFGVERDSAQPEQFVMDRHGIRFVGLSLPGDGTPEENREARLNHALSWLASTIRQAPDQTNSLVIVTHSFPSRHHRGIADLILEASSRWEDQVLLVHGDGAYFLEDVPHSNGPGHSHPGTANKFWRCDQPWPDLHARRIQLDPIHVSPPLRLETGGPDQPSLQWDRRYFRGPYLTCSGTDSIVVSWRAQLPSNPTLRFGPKPGQWEREIPTSALVRKTNRDASSGARPLSSAPDGIVQFDARLEGLKPGTRYFYAIYEGDHLVCGGDDQHTFSTHPQTGEKAPLRCWIFGDSGRGNQPQADVRNSMLEIARRENFPPQLFLHCGDMAYSSGTDDEFQRHFFHPYAEVLPNTILWPTMSNHEGHSSDGNTDTGPYYDAFTLPTKGESGGVPSGTQSFFGFDYGNAHFICLCSYGIDQTEAGEQGRWLRANLKYIKERGTTDWLIAWFHHPAYTMGSHDGNHEAGLILMREHVLPVLEEGGVDLIFAGHSHTYERTMLIDGAYETPVLAANKVLDQGDGDPQSDGPYRKSPGLNPHEGHVSLVVGTGGTGMGRRGTCPVMKKIGLENGSILLDISGDTLNCRLITSEGECFDQFTIEKKVSVTPSRIAQPVELPPYLRPATIPLRLRVQSEPGTGKLQRSGLWSPGLPSPVEVEVEFEYHGTSWSGPEAFGPINLPVLEEFFLPLGLECHGEQFPLPTTTIRFLKLNDDEEITQPLLTHVEPWKRLSVGQLTGEINLGQGLVPAAKLTDLESGKGFIEFKGTGPAEFDTSFRVARTNQALFIDLFAHDPDPERGLVIKPHASEASSCDDCVEVFFQIEGEPHFYHFLVNVANQRLSCRDNWDSLGLAWPGNWTSATEIVPGGWRAQLLIPYSDLERPLATGDQIHFNVARNHAWKRVYSQWSHNNRTGAHSIQGFGIAKCL